MRLKMNTAKGQRSDVSDGNVEKCVSITDHKTIGPQTSRTQQLLLQKLLLQCGVK